MIKRIKVLLNYSFVKFCIVGLSGVFVDLGFLIIFFEILGINILFSSTLSFSLAVINNYLLNKAWTFRDRSEAVPTQFVKFYSTALFGLLLNTGIMLVLIGFGWHYILAKVLIIIIVSVWNYSINKIWVFKNQIEKI